MTSKLSVRKHWKIGEDTGLGVALPKAWGAGGWAG